jgi:glycosyltransferase involved in cell wall biosynthesis
MSGGPAPGDGSVAVIIVTLNERACLEATLERVIEERPDEVVVADGGSVDGTQELVVPPARLVSAPAGRASQISAGIAATGSDVVLILHADTLLPRGGVAAVRAAVLRGAVGGAFHKRFASSRALLRGGRWRTRLWWALGLSFGDQAQFATRDALLRLGGFPFSRTEDMELALRLRRLGAVALLREEVVTSARRLERDGILLTWARWWLAGTAAYVRLRLGQLGR